MKYVFSTVDHAVDAISRGQVVIVVDAEDRENEGDFVCSSQMATPEVINFMLGGRGQLCVSVLADRAKRCELQPVVFNNDAPLSTAFLTPIDHYTTKTGITARERSATILALANPECTAPDFVRPGHVFPLLAQAGGVLQRAGHTEASMDLARLAGHSPSGVLCEILDKSGGRPSRETLFDMAQRHNLEIISIEQLIAHRCAHEQYVHRRAATSLQTKFGKVNVISYEVDYQLQQPTALVIGNVTSGTTPLVYNHSSHAVDDICETLTGNDHNPLHLALQRISHEGVGVVVCLPKERHDLNLVDQLHASVMQDPVRSADQTRLSQNQRIDNRAHDIGMQILKDLGINRARMLTNQPAKSDEYCSTGSELEIVDQVPLLPHNFDTSSRSIGHRGEVSIDLQMQLNEAYS